MIQNHIKNRFAISHRKILSAFSPNSVIFYKSMVFITYTCKFDFNLHRKRLIVWICLFEDINLVSIMGSNCLLFIISSEIKIKNLDRHKILKDLYQRTT